MIQDKRQSRGASRRDFLTVATGAAAVAVGFGQTSLLADDVARPPREVPWLAEVQRPADPPAAPAPALSPLLVDAEGRPITSLDAWRKHRAAISARWLEFLGTMEVRRDQPPRLEVIEEDVVESVVRKRVRYTIEPGLTTEGYLLHPREASGMCPGAVVFHSTVDHSIRQPAGLEGVPEKHFGLKLAKRGFVTFSPRNFLWPDNGRIAAQEEAKIFQERHPKAKGMAKMLYDAQVAVDILAAQPQVDGKRLCCVGHSLGAKEVLYLAAFDERIRATISSEGGIGTTFSNWEAPWYLGNSIKRPEFKLEHHELLALAAPHPFLLIGGDSADGAASWPFIAAALPVYRLFGEPARLGLLNHRKGHLVPPEIEPRIYDWLETYC